MPKEYVVLSSDPFARADFIRRIAEEGECDWCGSNRKLYQYGHEEDGLSTRPHFHPKHFCSVGCYRSYAED